MARALTVDQCTNAFIGRSLVSRPTAIVVAGPGTNRDGDALLALDLAGAEPSVVLAGELTAEPGRLDEARIVVVAGGFSYGDALGAGRVLALDLTLGDGGRLGDRLRDFVASGRPVIGICNGFQVLTRAGLLPGALGHNEQGRFDCRWVELAAEPASTCIWTAGLDDPVHCPIAHGEGRYVHPDPAALAAAGHSRPASTHYPALPPFRPCSSTRRTTKSFEPDWSGSWRMSCSAWSRSRSPAVISRWPRHPTSSPISSIAWPASTLRGRPLVSSPFRHRAAGVDAHHSQRVVGRALEAVGRPGRDHHDVAAGDGELVVADREGGGTGLHDEDLRVGMEVQRRTLAARVLGDEDRDRRLIAALEQRRRALAQVVDRSPRWS